MAKSEEKTPPEIIVVDKYANMDFSNVKAVGSLVDLEQFVPPIYSGKEMIGKPLVLLDYQLMDAESGDFDNEWMLLTCHDFETDDRILVSTGSMFVMPAVQHIVDTLKEPVTFQFVKLGRSYKIGDVDNAPF